MKYQYTRVYWEKICTAGTVITNDLLKSNIKTLLCNTL